MLARLGKARDQILLASSGKLNIIDESGHTIMNVLVDEIKKSPIEAIE